MALLAAACDDGEPRPALRIAAWNLEHLDDTGADGCVPRTQADYDALTAQVNDLALDIVAFQEVENDAAAHRVFPKADWQVEVSFRPDTGPGRACWSRPDQQLGRLATGFAIRRGIDYRRNADLDALGEASAFQRWGTDITVTEGGQGLRLLSVHLVSGCWGVENDAAPGDAGDCSVLRGQISRLKNWADARRADGSAFIILGDFNRRLAVPDDWGWQILSPPSAPLVLPTTDLTTQCDPRYTAFIDHLVLGGGAEALLVPELGPGMAPAGRTPRSLRGVGRFQVVSAGLDAGIKSVYHHPASTSANECETLHSNPGHKRDDEKFHVQATWAAT